MNPERKIILVLGKTRFGKTTLTRAILSRMARVIVVEHRDEYKGTPFTDFDAMADHCAANERFFVSWNGGQHMAGEVFHLAFNLQNVCVCLEECANIAEEGSYFDAIYTGGNPAQISILGVSQRPHLIGLDLRSQASEVFAFNTTEPSALEWMRAFFGERTRELAKMPKYMGIHYNADEEVSVRDFIVQRPLNPLKTAFLDENA